MNDHGRAARAGAPDPAALTDPSMVRVSMSPLAHQAVCASCFRHSPIVPGAESVARTRVAELGWASNSGGVLCCPICARRAAPPVRRVSRPTRIASGVTAKSRSHGDGASAPPPPAPAAPPSDEPLEGGLCDSLPE